MSEQLRFGQRLGENSAVVYYERTAGPRTQVMDDPGEVAFPGPGRPEQQDVIARRADLGGETAHTFREVVPLIFPPIRGFAHITPPAASTPPGLGELRRQAKQPGCLGLLYRQRYSGARESVVQ